MTESSEFVGHKALLSEIIERLETDELKYYSSTSSFNYWAWHFCAVGGFLASLFAGLIASFSNGEKLEGSLRIALVLLPAIATTLTGMLQICKFREKEALREEGRIEILDSIDNAKSLMWACKDENDFRAAFHQVRERVKALSLAQHRKDVALRMDSEAAVDRQSVAASRKAQPKRTL